MTDPEQDKLKHNSTGSRIGQPQAGPSDFGEGKPQGRGFHKPNEKHTLDEVLKSLQDLIHNDLLKGERAQPEEPAAPEPAPAAEETPAAAAPEETDPAAAIPDISLPAADMPLGAVVQLLEDLVKNDLTFTDDSMDGGGTTPGMGKVERRLEQPPGATQGAVADEPGQAPATTMPDSEPPTAPAAPTTGQQAFSFDDAGSSVPTEPEPIPAPLALDEPEPSAPVAESSDFDEFTVDLAPPPGDFSKAENEVVEEIIAETPPDLPVLTDAVAETTTPPIDDLPVLEEIALGSPDNNPAAIAARVIARLNADRRARGEAEFDDATLDALRTLLRDEIERHQSER